VIKAFNNIYAQQASRERPPAFRASGDGP